MWILGGGRGRQKAKEGELTLGGLSSPFIYLFIYLTNLYCEPTTCQPWLQVLGIGQRVKQKINSFSEFKFYLK